MNKTFLWLLGLAAAGVGVYALAQSQQTGSSQWPLLSSDQIRMLSGRLESSTPATGTKQERDYQFIEVMKWRAPLETAALRLFPTQANPNTAENSRLDMAQGAGQEIYSRLYQMGWHLLNLPVAQANALVAGGWVRTNLADLLAKYGVA